MPADVRSLMQIEVPLIVQLASRPMSMGKVLSICPGSIIELGKPADDDLEILVNNKPIGLGRAVKIGENYGVRVTCVGNARQRLTAMRSSAAPARPATPPVHEAGDEPA
ncbi:MAG: FliM/FliN family flagellar motor switch protein [Planctomycetota bacterium]|jgi:flagellar motor switch protein FliN/FliY